MFAWKEKLAVGYSPESIDARPTPIVEHFMLANPQEAGEDWDSFGTRCELNARLAIFIFEQAQAEDSIRYGGSSENLENLVDFLLELEENNASPTKKRDKLLMAMAKSFPYVEQSDFADILGDELLRTAALKLQTKGESLKSCFEIVDKIEHPDFRDRAYQQLMDNL